MAKTRAPRSAPARRAGAAGGADFIVRLKGNEPIHLILETKGFDELAEVKAGAAERWVAAVNADGQFGRWMFAMVRSVPDARTLLDGLRNPSDAIKSSPVKS